MTKAKMLETLVAMYADRYEARRETRDILEFDCLTDKERSTFKDIYMREFTQCTTLEDVAEKLFGVNLFDMYLDNKWSINRK